MILDLPADDLATAGTQDNGQIQPAFGRRQLGEVAHPDWIGPGRGGPLGQPVLRHGQAGLTLRGERAEAALGFGAYPLLPQEPSPTVLATPPARPAQGRLEARTAVRGRLCWKSGGI